MAQPAPLFDGPASAPDPEMVSEVLDVIRGLARGGMIMAVVTHEMAVTRQVADRVAALDSGCIVEVGAPAQVFTTPQHARNRMLMAPILQ